jgi:hypothetical protein
MITDGMWALKAVYRLTLIAELKASVGEAAWEKLSPIRQRQMLGALNAHGVLYLRPSLGAKIRDATTLHADDVEWEKLPNCDCEEQCYQQRGAKCWIHPEKRWGARV